MFKKMKSNWVIIVMAVLCAVILFVAYSNHFSNGFYFDDVHTIGKNKYIRDLSNIPLFFTDIKYYGTMPGNQSYNPILVTLNTLDYWLGGNQLNSKMYHFSIFFWYCFQLVLMFFFFRNILDIFYKDKSLNTFFSLFAVSFYSVLTPNAETINYIIMRSDSFSTFCIVASFTMYQYAFSRKYFLYLIPLLFGLGTKETTIMFGVMLFAYIYFIEFQGPAIPNFSKSNKRQLTNSIFRSLPSIFVCSGFFFIMWFYFLSGKPIFAPTSAPSKINYFMTQWVVISHYIGNFFIPLDLSVDPDFSLITSFLNQKALYGLLLIIGLVGLAIYCSFKKELLPATFGIFWFFLALAPTSSFKPLGQLANDHRTFFPYIGIVLSIMVFIRYAYLKRKALFKSNSLFYYVLPAFVFLIICFHAYGTYQRNIVWSSAEKLWEDGVTKSPNNSRTQLNYGVALMGRGEYKKALKHFKKAEELDPRWAYVKINLGIIHEQLKDFTLAEQYFNLAHKVQPNIPDTYFYYARFLNNQNRSTEAIFWLKNGLKLSNGHIGMNRLYNKLKKFDGFSIKEQLAKRELEVKEDPTPEKLLDLSLSYYKNNQYNKCISLCQEALKINPNYALAYNNICSSYNAMQEWRKAKEACEKAIAILPNYQLAKNNLKWAKDELKKQKH